MVFSPLLLHLLDEGRHTYTTVSPLLGVQLAEYELRSEALRCVSSNFACTHCVALSYSCSVVCLLYTLFVIYIYTKLFQIEFTLLLQLFRTLTFPIVFVREVKRSFVTVVSKFFGDILFFSQNFDVFSPPPKSIYVYIRIGAQIGTVQNGSQGLTRTARLDFPLQTF